MENNELKKQPEILKSDKMGTMPIGKLLFSMSLPAMVSMLVQALYNIVDSIFVSQYSEAAFTAVNLAFPMIMLVIAFGVGIGVGANAQIAKKLGEGDRDGANKVAQNSIFLALIVYAFFVVLVFTCSDLFFKMFTQDAEIIRLGKIYLFIYMGLSAFSLVEMTCSKILQATGNMKIPMLSQLIGAVINIILDPILINGIKIGGAQIVPELGVAGAAIATIIGQFVAMVFVITVFIKKKQDVSISLRGFRPSKKAIGEICKIGLPATVMNAITSVTIAVLNGVIAGYIYAVDSLGIYFKVQSFVFMPVFGLTQGALPILSYNFGANNRERYRQTVKLSIIIAVAIMAVGTLVFQFLPQYIIQMFGIAAEMAPASVTTLKIISISFVPAAFAIIMTTVFQSLGSGLKSLLMSLSRQLVFLIPVAIVMESMIGLNGVWWAYPISELLSVLLFVIIVFRTYKKAFAERCVVFK